MDAMEGQKAKRGVLVCRWCVCWVLFPSFSAPKQFSATNLVPCVCGEGAGQGEERREKGEGRGKG